MPLWTAGYFGLYLAFSGWSLVDDYRKKEPAWLMGCDVISEVCLLAPAFAYWVPSVHTALVSALLPVFTAGVLLFAAFLARALRRQFADPDLPPQGKAFVIISGSAMVALMAGPILVWGFRAAVLGEHVDA